MNRSDLISSLPLAVLLSMAGPSLLPAEELPAEERPVLETAAQPVPTHESPAPEDKPAESPAADPVSEPVPGPEEEPLQGRAEGTIEEHVEELSEQPADEEITDVEDRSMFMQALETGQGALSRSVTRLSRRMDLMLGAQEVYPDETYDSVLRVRLIQRFGEGGSELQPDVSGRLSLPGTEERIGLIFTSDDYENPLDRERGTELGTEASRKQSVALRLLKPVDLWKTSLSAGVRTGSDPPISTVTRGRVWRDFQVGYWSIRPRQTMFWYSDRGIGETSDIRIQYPLDVTVLFRSDTGATWFQRDEAFYYDQTLSVLQPLGHKLDLVWQSGVQAESQPNSHITRYYAQLRIRRKMYRDWLILEMRPQMSRARENNYRTESFFYVGFELLFGGPGSY